MKIKRNTAGGLIRSIFNFEVDSRIIGFSEEHSIDRKFFWKNIYVSRTYSENEFEDFINSENSSLLIINGHVGTGKSTFLRHKFEKLKLNSGLIIDLRGKNNYIKCNSQNDVDEATFTIIKNVFLKSIFENIKLNLSINKKYIKNREEYFDRYDYCLNKTIPKIKLNPLKEAELDEHVNFQIALEIINLLSNSNSVKKFRTDNQIGGFNSNTLRGQVCEVFEEKPGLIHKVINDIEWFNLLELYRKLFDLNKSFVLVFDNFDVVPLKKVKNYFLETLINVSNFLNGNTDFPHNQNSNSNHVKLVFSIRDENISRYSRHSRAAFFDTQIIIGNDGFLMTNTDKAKRIPIDKVFCYQVIMNRLNMVKENIIYLSESEQEIAQLFIKITESFWVDKNKETIRSGFGYIDIQELSNDSIRLILDFIVDLTLGVISTLIKQKDSLDYLLNYYFLKGRMINELWKHKSTSVILQNFKMGFLREIEQGSYCIYRLIIAYLYNKPNRVATSEDIYSKINSVFGCGKIFFQKALLDLFNSDLKESEFISVYYNNPLEYFEDKIEISNETEIKLNQKGVLLIERLIIHIDFFGKLTENQHGFYNITHTQLKPQDFYKYYNAIFNFILKLKDKHIYLYQTITHYYSDFSNPFNGYEKDFTIRAVFFLERVAESHKHYLKNYIIHNLSVSDLIDKNSKFEQDDAAIEKIINTLKPNNILKKIWYKFYKKLTPRIINEIKKERQQF